MNLMYKIILVVYLLYIDVDAQQYNVKDYGADPTGKNLSTNSIQNTINDCYQKGGGTVYIPAGKFIVGTIVLRSNINLFLEKGSELIGSCNITDYKTYKADNFHETHYGIIYAHKEKNVSITGYGTVNGNEEVFFDWDKAKTIEWSGVQNTRQKENFRKVENGIGDGPVTPKERPRQMVIFSECYNVEVTNVNLIKSPFWTLHFADCDGVIVSGVKIWTSLETPNSDGLDITSCSNVIVSNCDIRTGDDAIAITGYAYHFELPGFNNLRNLSQNIVISNCNLQSRSSGIRIGFLDQNSIRNVTINNINITNSNRGIGIFVRDEGSIENITISQVNIDTRLHTGDWWGNGEPIHISAVVGNPNVKLGQIKNISFRDITCQGETGVLVYGSKERLIKSVSFDNLKFHMNKSRLSGIAGGNIDLRGAFGDRQLFASNISGFYAQFVENIKLNNIEITWDAVTDDYFTHGIHIKNFDGLKMNGITASSSPSNKRLSTVLVENGIGLKSDLNTKVMKIWNVK